MRQEKRAEIEAVGRLLAVHSEGAATRAAEFHDLLRSGAGEDALVERIQSLDAAPGEAQIELARALLRLGVKPPGAGRKARRGKDVCTVCNQQVPFCWGCRCDFRICQACLEENRWGITCNNITWECPDCGAMRSF